MAPQLEHSALTPPGAELPLEPRRTAGLRLVAVAPGPDERVVGVAAWVRTVREGRPRPDDEDEDEPAIEPKSSLSLEGVTVSGRTSFTACERGGTVIELTLLL